MERTRVRLRAHWSTATKVLQYAYGRTAASINGEFR